MKRYTKEVQEQIRKQKKELKYICGIYLLQSGFHMWATFKEYEDAKRYAMENRCEILKELEDIK